MSGGDFGSANLKEFLQHIEEIGAIAQIGLKYAKDDYDIDRYERLRAIVASMLSLSSDLPENRAREWLSIDKNYATPKIDVRAVVIQDGKVLLVKERSDACWALPGGWCEVNESPKEAVEKEVWEETGLRVHATRLLAFFDKHKHDHPPQLPHAYKCFFLCEIAGGELKTDTQEASAIKYFPTDELPSLSLHRVTEKQIQTTYSIALDPSHPTLFD